MPLNPTTPVRFLRAHPGGPVPFDTQLLDALVPTQNPIQTASLQTACRYGTYLDCIRQFIIKYSAVLAADLLEDYSIDSCHYCDIITEKHGSDYHPARIVFHGPESDLSLVVNVAMTDRGRLRLKEDFRLLGFLRKKYQSGFIPREYILGDEVPCDANDSGISMLMFLAEWFDGFHEFHLSAGAGDESLRVILWDMDQGYAALTDKEAGEVYRQAASILTFFYDTTTFEEIFPWHHASGDFVVRRDQGEVQVRLITVRQYAARPVFADPLADNRLIALLLFFANLTVRMRIDRLDGVGDIAWAGEQTVRATVQGFVDGMRMKVEEGHCDPELLDNFVRTLQSMPLPELADLFHAVIESYDPEAPDTPVVEKHLVDHVYQVYKSVQDIFAPR